MRCYYGLGHIPNPSESIYELMSSRIEMKNYKSATEMPLWNGLFSGRLSQCLIADQLISSRIETGNYMYMRATEMLL